MNRKDGIKRGRPRRRSGPGRLSVEEAENLPNRLLDAAAALFLEKGYAKATMEGVARAAQASTKTVYSRFDNKGEILAAVIRRLVEQTVAQLTAEVDAMVEGSEPRAFLHELGLRFATLVTAKQTVGINRLVIAEAARFPELVTVFSEGPGRAVDIIRAALERWRRQNRLPLMPQPAIAATIFYDMATSTPRLQALLGKPMPPRALEAHVGAAVDLFLRGCGEPRWPDQAGRFAAAR
jgi:TetR/AcrR family transcriptional regulator, mexJK operon transcriptional repressor